MLLMELKHYEVNNKFNEDVVYETDSFENRGVIPANTRLQMEIKANDMAKKPHVQISLSTNNSTIIKSVVIFAEGIFKGETHIVHPQASKLCPDLSVSLFLPKDTPIDIHVKAMVGYPNTVQFHIFEITRQLPRFSMYSLIPTPESNMPEGYVQFKVNERLERICMWINQNFLLESDIDVQPGHTLTISFKCLRNGLPLVLNFEKSGNFKFYTDSMLLASDLIQSMTSYLNIDTLKSVAVFPDEEKCLKLLIDNLSNMEDANLRLGADFTQKLREIGTLVIQAEDSRLCNETEMISFYHELMKLNEDMINEHNIRLRNYTEGVNTMKQINAFLQKTSRLRVGQKSSDILNHCRNAIKTNNIEELINIIRRGET
ncbi:hypothetical protein NQ317_008045 [Molorchus minor]|uniref:Uncharacterized protein n=1 Tax=Molorchus minor TaxID=1323400 RepID=A0ABQ9JR03_9CUCU|nr:hypothetical protein NQ317_008045 [Molorchus minor]